jgi:hypothetical protein
MISERARRRVLERLDDERGPSVAEDEVARDPGVLHALGAPAR